MTLHCNTITQLAALLRENGDKILDASSRLSLSSSLLHNLNQSIITVLSQETDDMDEHLDLKIVYDFLQQTVALKVLPDFAHFRDKAQTIDICLFKNLTLLEIKWLSLKLIKGIKSVRTQLEYLICMHSLNALHEVLESCGDDKCQGFIWSKLKEAVFSYNGLSNLDNSLEFTPWLCSLDLSHNNLSNVEYLSCLPNLTFLNLCYNKLENVPYLRGEICTNLKKLILHNNFIDNIKELSPLSSLEVLDLRNNSLVEYGALVPLGGLSKLNKLFLSGNPMSFDSKYKQITVQYLNPTLSGTKFLLDSSSLGHVEKQLLGTKLSYLPSQMSNSHFDSLDSLASNNTVIPFQQNFPTDNNNSQMSDTDASSFTTTDNEPENGENDNDGDGKSIDRFNRIWPILEERGEVAMNDSGIVAGNRPDTPSVCSIGSASSLINNEPTGILATTTIFADGYESDIEILSNPSQSSIEVLHRFSTNCS
ncbi:serine/threonine-protein kinase 11-interacting protein-like [Agrilus planipennis]|uniref:Serine/threonine-protein kinase 11-interacting protein-like n=1 Tax=Agrilus planipennis TaxID=224129 RepID=A0A1W4WRP9_AGRPL|nr:serine/threonine-protein kinase 11-interacting protein-like [Agrilus planipennis]